MRSSSCLSFMAVLGVSGCLSSTSEGNTLGANSATVSGGRGGGSVDSSTGGISSGITSHSGASTSVTGSSAISMANGGSSTSTASSTSAGTGSGGAGSSTSGIAGSTTSGGCTNDGDCPACGWVCSHTLGRICVPSMMGDPGWCEMSGYCGCPGQTCVSNHCTPRPQPQCKCNSDCPSGLICDQLTFTCHPADAAVFCGGQSPPASWGGCGCGSLCGGGISNPSCEPFSLQPGCSSDADCDTCETGRVCGSDGGLSICWPAFDGGWCP